MCFANSEMFLSESWVIIIIVGRPSLASHDMRSPRQRGSAGYMPRIGLTSGRNCSWRSAPPKFPNAKIAHQRDSESCSSCVLKNEESEDESRSILRWSISCPTRFMSSADEKPSFAASSLSAGSIVGCCREASNQKAAEIPRVALTTYRGRIVGSNFTCGVPDQQPVVGLQHASH